MSVTALVLLAAVRPAPLLAPASASQPPGQRSRRHSGPRPADGTPTTTWAGYAIELPRGCGCGLGPLPAAHSVAAEGSF